MSFIYSPTNIGATGMATYAASLLGNVAASPSGALPPVPTGTNGFLQAIMDIMLGGIGYRDSNDAFAVGTFSSTAGAVSPSWEDVGNGTTTGFSSWTFTVPAAKQYEIMTNCSVYKSSSTGSTIMSFRLVVDGVAQTSPLAAATSWGDVHRHVSFSHAVTLSAGSHTVKLQWQVSTGLVVRVDAATEGRQFVVRG